MIALLELSCVRAFYSGCKACITCRFALESHVIGGDEPIVVNTRCRDVIVLFQLRTY
jgi:hypothetical protein